jgi:hypothetical protein
MTEQEYPCGEVLDLPPVPQRGEKRVRQTLPPPVFFTLFGFISLFGFRFVPLRCRITRVAFSFLSKVHFNSRTSFEPRQVHPIM